MQNGDYCIFANRSYGLYCGELMDITQGPDGQLDCIVGNCRHICKWHGLIGGITSLAAGGICGPEAHKSRIGEACETSRLTCVVNIFKCSSVARRSLEEHGTHHDS